MKRTVAKSLVLVLLILGSLYQIITLWFDQVSDRNFFYSFIDRAKNSILSEENRTEKAFMNFPHVMDVYLGASDKDFTIIKKASTTMDYSILYDSFNKVLIKGVKKGELKKVETKGQEIWQERSLLFNLPFPMSGELFANDLGIDPSLLEEIKGIQTVGISPANEKRREFKVYLIEEDSNIFYLYTLSTSELQEENKVLNDAIVQMEGREAPAYISTLKNDIELFKHHVLLPLPSGNNKVDLNLSFSVPFVDEDEIQFESLEKYINHFFDNPDVKWVIQNNDATIFGDDNALIKYSNKGVLEYSSIKSNQDLKLNIPDAYNVSTQFLASDILLEENNYTLADYEKIGDKVIFYYNYLYDDLEIYFNDDTLLQNNMEYPIEVMVEGGRVFSYRRLVFIKERVYQDQELFASRFEDALDLIVDKFNIEEEKLEDMHLGYVKMEDYGKLMWIFKYQGEVYWIDIHEH